MNPVILYRPSLLEDGELESMQKYFDCYRFVSDIPKGSLVIGRLSLMPHYRDVELEIIHNGSALINTYNDFRYIADLGNYVYDLKSLTPRTWDNITTIPEGKFILKGETNSKKSSWLKDMYAPNKAEAINIYNRLSSDSLIGEQKIYIREYVPLYKYLDGINGMPVTKEFRFFVANGVIISSAFYWQNYSDDIDHVPNPSEVPQEFLNKVISIVSKKSNFYVMDIAQKENGDWTVIELNDGQTSGLSGNESDILYKNLKNCMF